MLVYSGGNLQCDSILHLMAVGFLLALMFELVCWRWKKMSRRLQCKKIVPPQEPRLLERLAFCGCRKRPRSDYDAIVNASEEPSAPDSLVRLACPRCHVLFPETDRDLRCVACGASYPHRATVNVLLEENEWADLQEHLSARRGVHDAYVAARRVAPLGLLYFDIWVKRMLEMAVTEDGALASPSRPSGPLLELMCGGAEICRRLPSRFSSACALDLNVEMVEQAAQDLESSGEKRVRCVCGTAAHLPFADGAFETVLIQGGLHHVRFMLPAVLAEISRVLKTGGVLVASEPANDHFVTRAIRRWQYQRSIMQGDDPDEDGFTRDELAAALQPHGLRLEQYTLFGFIAYPLMGNTDLLPVLSRSRSRFLGRMLLGMDWILEKIPGIRGMAWASISRAVKI